MPQVLYVKVFYLWPIKAIAKMIMTFKSALQIALTRFYLWSTYFENLIQVCIKYHFIGVLWHCSQWLLKMVLVMENTGYLKYTTQRCSLREIVWTHTFIIKLITWFNIPHYEILIFQPLCVGPPGIGVHFSR